MNKISIFFTFSLGVGNDNDDGVLRWKKSESIVEICRKKRNQELAKKKEIFTTFFSSVQVVLMLKLIHSKVGESCKKGQKIYVFDGAASFLIFVGMMHR
jgi:Ser-tRNA(Ala) deacylase AlaX